MRIIGGKYGGRKIEVSRGFNSRPTTDFAKEALFNILSNQFDFEEVTVLDLFGGTGSISFEFSSRGCPSIDLVENNSKSVYFIGKVAADLGLKGIHAVRMDVFRFIPVCKRKYNIIFADPPYELPNAQEIPQLVFNHNLLLPGGSFILEHGKSLSFREDPRFSEERNYGSVHFTFFA